jgi:phosphoglycolate phosphatase
MTKQKTLIFDFDGTLADTFGIAVGVFRKLARKSHSTDDAAVEQLRSMPAREALKHLGVRWYHLPFIIFEARKAVREQMAAVEAIADIEPVLHQLHQRGYRMFIVSSNSTKNIKLFLTNNKLADCFDEFWGGQGIFAKAAALRKVARKNNLSLSDCVYIGDEVRDIDAAQHAGMPYVVCSWGYNSRKALQSAHAETIINQPKELLKLFP